MLPAIQAQVDLIVSTHVGKALVKRRYQGNNIALKAGLLNLATVAWAAVPGQGGPICWPWRTAPGYDGLSLLIKHVAFDTASFTAADRGYLASVGSPFYTGHDPTRYMRRLLTQGSQLAATDPRVLGAIIGYQGLGNSINNECKANTFSEIATTQIGTPYGHPVYTGTLTTVLGAGYVTTFTTLTNPDWGAALQHTYTWIRIESGADKGVYIVRHWDRTNSRIYLMNIDGTPFTASAAATLVPYSAGIRMAFFNEVGVIPNGVGTASFDGNYVAGENRTSYLFRIRYEKTGSPSPADASQKGTYWLSIRSWLYGDGILTNTIRAGIDNGWLSQNRIDFSGSTAATVGFFPTATAGFIGSAPALTLDRTNQRLWIGATDGTNGSIGWFRYKAPETLHEVATSSGVVNDPILGITLAANVLPRGAVIGSDNTVYFVLGITGAGAGYLKIDPTTLVANQILASGLAGVPTNPSGIAIDTTRARTGAAGDVATTVGTGTVTTASGGFTNADIGRVIVLTGLLNPADNGTYKISAVGGATTITVQTLAGGAVVFAGTTGGTFRIGDRLYLFFNNTTSSPVGTLTYMESLAWGTKLTVAMAGVPVNGANVSLGPSASGVDPAALAVDPSNGVVYWASSDVAVQINRYDPATQTWSRRLISDFNGLNGGSGTIVNPTLINCLGVNPNSYFRELWIGTDAGWVMISPDAFGGATWSRYYGDAAAATPYAKPAGIFHLDGADNGMPTRVMRRLAFGIDGRVLGFAAAAAVNSGIVAYDRETDTWARSDIYPYVGITATTVPNWVATPYGELPVVIPNTKAATSIPGPYSILTHEIHYQYIGAVWVPKEVIRGAIPDSISSPGLSAKDLHTTLDDLIMGLKVQFTPQGGATPANNEFLGRLATTGAARADGGTTIGTATFTGSAFVAGDVGRILRIHAGADVGVYRITVFTNANTITLAKMNPGTAWAAAATAGALTYSIWDMQGSTLAGPEVVTVVGANGFMRDNTQDITNIQYEFFGAKTLLSEQVEAVKFAMAVLGPPGSPGPRVYLETYPNTTNPNYTAHIPQGLALPGAPLALGTQAIDGQIDRQLDNTVGRASSAMAGTWGGKQPAAGTTGYNAIVDFGVAVEIGAIIARIATNVTAQPHLNTDTNNTGGAITNVYNAPDTGAPAAASVIRTSGAANLSVGASSTTLALGVGDFTGALTTSGVDGSTTLGGSRFTSATVGKFTGMRGQLLRITTGLDVGYYRIVVVDPVNGSYVDITSIDQTVKQFAAAAAGLSFEVRDGVQEEDIIHIPSVAAGTHKLTVERLLSTTTAQVRCYATGALNNVSWEAAKPTWTKVKRISYSVEALPPDVVGNLTYVSDDGTEAGAVASLDTLGAFKIVADLSDLTTAQRSGRYWKVALSGRWPTLSAAVTTYLASLEFYSPAGKRVDHVAYTKLDTVDTQPQFMACHITRLDWIEANDTAASHVAGSNGLAALGGTAQNTVTLAGGNRFLGFQVRPPAAGGNIPGGNALVNAGGADPVFVTSDTGRFLRITSGVNAGYYRIATVLSTTQVSVVTPGTGAAVVLVADAGPVTFAVHEGIATGTTTGDIIAFTTGGVGPANRELTVLSIDDALTTIITAEKYTGVLAAQNWEIRRRATPTTSAVVDGTMIARIIYSSNAYPLQPGDVSQDSHGYFGFWAADVGPATNVQHADGGTTVATAGYTGSGFTPDDVGRILVILTGVDKGAYQISTYVSAASITVKNAYTGAAVSFGATAGALPYYVQGERRFRAARYATVLRT